MRAVMMRMMFVVTIMAVVLSFGKPVQAADEELWVTWIVNPGETKLTQRFDLSGNLLSTLSPAPPNPPRGLQLVPGGGGVVHVAVPAIGVQRFDPSTQAHLGNYLTGITGGATDVGSDAAGNLYVSNQFHEVFKGNLDGTGMTQIVGPGAGSNSVGIAVDRNGTIYLGDNTDNVVRKYNSAGALQATFTGNALSIPQGVEIGPDGKIYVANGGGGGNISRFLADGTADGNFPATAGDLFDLAFASNGDLYVGTGFGNTGIEIFDSTITSQGIFPHANFSSNANNQILGIDFIPEPSTAGLIGLGMLFVLNRRRKA